MSTGIDYKPGAGTREVEAALLRPLSAAEAQYVDSLLKRAARLIMREVKPVVEWDAGFQETVNDVQAEMVARRFRNVEGYAAEGDGTYNYRLDMSVASGKLQLTDDDRAELGIATEGGFWVWNPQYGSEV